MEPRTGLRAGPAAAARLAVPALLVLVLAAAPVSAQNVFWGDGGPLFWTVVQENNHGRPYYDWTMVNSDPANAATVTVEDGSGASVTYNLPPGGWQTFTELAPSPNVGFPATPRKTTDFVHRFNASSDQVHVHQMAVPAASSLMSEGSTLLEQGALGTEYTIVGSSTYHVDKSHSVVVVATEPGTQVSITPHGTGFLASPLGDFAAMAAGTTTVLALDDFESLRLLSDGETTGTRITATHPIAVFYVVDGSKPVQSSMGLNHIEEQMLPDDALGTEYVSCAGSVGLGFDSIRIVAAEGGGATTVTIDPAPVVPSAYRAAGSYGHAATGSGFTLAGGTLTLAGQGSWFQFDTAKDTHIEADRNIAVSDTYGRHYQATLEPLGDPAMIRHRPVAGWTERAFLYAPGEGWPVRSVVVAGEFGATVELDGAARFPLAARAGGSDYGCAKVPLLGEGRHTLRATSGSLDGAVLLMGQSNAMWYPVHPAPPEPAAPGEAGSSMLAAPMGLLAGLAFRGRRARA